jgi:predicted MPP superfamily phosphohydrolase
MFALLIFLGGITAVYGAEFLVFLKYLATKLQKRRWKGHWTLWCLHGVSLVGLACFFYGYAIEPSWIDVTTVTIHTPKLLHSSFRILHFSDLHCERTERNEGRLITIINELEPDIILFTGDTLNTRQALPRFQRTMNALRARLGKYAVRGNYDIWSLHDLELFHGTGFTVLDGQRVHVLNDDDTLCLAGVSPAASEQFSSVLATCPVGNYTIFLYHYPDLIEDLAHLSVDLYLAGHTHGGQVALPLYGALLTLSKYGKKYESGAYQVGETLLYVNRGIGMEGGVAPRVRFGSRPEITVFHVLPEHQQEQKVGDE